MAFARSGWRWPVVQCRQECGDRSRGLGRTAAGKVVAYLVQELNASISQDRR
jgi:hypothetical protein